MFIVFAIGLGVRMVYLNVTERAFLQDKATRVRCAAERCLPIEGSFSIATANRWRSARP